KNRLAIIGLHLSNQVAIPSRVALALARSLRWVFLRAGGVNRYGLSPLISTGVKVSVPARARAAAVVGRHLHQKSSRTRLDSQRHRPASKRALRGGLPSAECRQQLAAARALRVRVQACEKAGASSRAAYCSHSASMMVAS